MNLKELINKKIKKVIEESNEVKIIFDDNTFYCFKVVVDHDGSYDYATLVHGDKEIDDLISPYIY